MRKPTIHNRYSHYLYGVLQSAITCGIAAAITIYRSPMSEHYFQDWSMSWLLSWITMLPVVIFFAPILKRWVENLTH